MFPSENGDVPWLIMLIWVEQCHFYHSWLRMVNIPTIYGHDCGIVYCCYTHSTGYAPGLPFRVKCGELIPDANHGAGICTYIWVSF